MNNNPLRQFFRRPAVYIKLPSNGKYYTHDVIDMPDSGELPVYPMTAIDDITLRTPDGLFNGTAIADIMKSCVPNIKDPWKINNIDFDAILIAIRSASGEQNLEIESTCPSCKEEASYGLDLIVALAGMKSGDYDTCLELNEMKIKFKPLTYREINQAAMSQFDAQRKFVEIDKLEDETIKNNEAKKVLEAITQLTIELLAKSIEYVEIPGETVNNPEFILDFMTNCDKMMFEELRDHITNLRNATQLKPLRIKCIHCSHEYEQPFTLNTSDFFA